jgi:hypothetical protein
MQTNQISPDDAQRVTDALIALCPTGMRDLFVPMVHLAVAQVPADILASLANDLESARDENGEADLPRLIEVGKHFGLTDEMIDGYRQAHAAQ